MARLSSGIGKPASTFAALIVVVVALLFLAPTSAHPRFWGDKEPTGVDPVNGMDGGCSVPSGKQDDHPGAQADDGDTVFEIVDASTGALVVDFEPGQTYNWTVTFPVPSESLLLASAGQLASNMSTHDDLNLCSEPGMRVTFSTSSPRPTVIMGNWTAPESADVESVVFDLVRAEGSSSYFYTTQVTMCREGATDCNAPTPTRTLDDVGYTSTPTPTPTTTLDDVIYPSTPAPTPDSPDGTSGAATLSSTLACGLIATAALLLATFN